MIKVCKKCNEQFKTNRSKREYCSHSCANKVITIEREKIKASVPISTLWSCGGGVDSTAIAVLICQGKLPKPDYAVMVDCGWEKTSTWEYIYSEVIPKLKLHGINLNVIKTTEYTNNKIIDSNGYITIPAYKKSEKPIKFKTNCNETWKVRAVKRWIKKQGVQRCVNWIGIAADESRRMRIRNEKWFTTRYPLVEMGITREDCLWLICSYGWKKPPRTSCFICPLQNDDSWLNTKLNYHDDWNKAIEVESMIHKINPDIYLHRSMVPLNEVTLGRGIKNL